MEVLKRFLNYIAIDTTSDSSKDIIPTTEGQRELAHLLIKELYNLNMEEIYYDEEHCYIYALLRGNDKLPKIGFISHLDTSEDACGKGIKPNIIRNYDGNDVVLNDGVTISTDIYPDLKKHIGKTLITSDGTTLLGADDKAGIAEIMSMLEHFSSSSEEHGDIYVCFTPDEEIGMGTEHFMTTYFRPNFAYTVDGSSLGEFSYENFNAATATINIKGISSHCGTAKGVMINAARIATIFQSLLPEEFPENTEGREGFIHLDELSGSVANAKMKYLIRDFDKSNFEKRKQVIRTIVDQLNKKYGNCIELTIKDTYQNMFEVISTESDLIDRTLKVISSIGIEPYIKPIRGGTDGAEISFLGIPCPNLGTGGHNFHSVFEYACLEDMEKVVELLIALVTEFSKIKENDKEKELALTSQKTLSNND